MKPYLVTPEIIEEYLTAGHWSRETMVERYATYARDYPNECACRDTTEELNWDELDTISSHIAACFVELGISRDATALVQMPSNCREIVLRVAFKRAGIIGVFVPLQWRRKELDYVVRRVEPEITVISAEHIDTDARQCIEEASDDHLRVNIGSTQESGWTPWQDMLDGRPRQNSFENLAERQFKFDEISLITASSGTSGLAKLCEWPEGAQLCQSQVLCERMEITGEDRVGIFAPTAGAAGLMMWMISWTVPCCCYFPETYRAPALLDLVERCGITVGSTVPVILVRLTQEPLESRNLSSLRLMRVGTAATDMSTAISFEDRSGCRIVIASGSMECTGFGHAHVNESKELRLNGSVGLPLKGCRLQIEDGDGNVLPPGEIGELKVTAPFSSSGYWKDPDTTAQVWSNGWYATGDVGILDDNGRLTLKGRLKDTINRSGHKILPPELEHEISRLPEVIECSVVSGPDREYGQVPWAFIQMRKGFALDHENVVDALQRSGLASYKMPTRFFEVTDFPRINDSKIDKPALLELGLKSSNAEGDL
ncbi:MAG: hypothetical protein CMM52_09210 [Rhodospirillaceae bacterium]|nr:hypothetical protein [Rhodospirillaceae bacterium]|tara:strand:- start:56 stop:1681 length:1626 start_codon:yes stop_codon:yes gene_type:complete